VHVTELAERIAQQSVSATTPAEIAAFGPDWALFWGDRVSLSQLSIWLPYLRRSCNRFLVMSGPGEVNPGVPAALAGVENVRLGGPLEEMKKPLRAVPGFRGAIYVSTRPANLSMVMAFPRRAHVWIGHGESEKGSSGPRAASLYDAVFVARSSAVGRFPNAVRPWVTAGACVIGAPITEGVVKAPWDRPRRVRTILYAPTWEGRRPGADFSSLPEVVPALARAMPLLRERGVDVQVRPHPGTGSRLPAYKAMLSELRSAGARGGSAKADDFAAADVMISDVSGVTPEFLFTEKPVIMPFTATLAARGRTSAAISRDYAWAYQWQVDAEDISALIDGLATEDPLARKRSVEAARMYRGHATLDEAARTFDTALATVGRGRGRVPLRWAFEARMRAGPLVDLAYQVVHAIRPRKGKRPRPSDPRQLR
jgi:CDP-Glycerol:Poly(glycerophosphate) glycerophosphotransferase